MVEPNKKSADDGESANSSWISHQRGYAQQRFFPEQSESGFGLLLNFYEYSMPVNETFIFNGEDVIYTFSNSGVRESLVSLSRSDDNFPPLLIFDASWNDDGIALIIHHDTSFVLNGMEYETEINYRRNNLVFMANNGSLNFEVVNILEFITLNDSGDYLSNDEIGLVPHPNGTHLLQLNVDWQLQLKDGNTLIEIRNPALFDGNGSYIRSIPELSNGNVRFDDIIGHDDGSWSLAGRWSGGSLDLGQSPPADSSSDGYFIVRWHPLRGFDSFTSITDVLPESSSGRLARIVEMDDGHCFLLSPTTKVWAEPFPGIYLKCSDWNSSTSNVTRFGHQLLGFEMVSISGNRGAFIATVNNQSSFGNENLSVLNSTSFVLGLINLTDLSVIRSTTIVGEGVLLAFDIFRTSGGIAFHGSFTENLTIETTRTITAKEPRPSNNYPYLDAFFYHRTDGDYDWIEDVDDDCRHGATNWTSLPSTDHDEDGCHDETEDTDDDNDGVPDILDNCAKGRTQWQSNLTLDRDADGCHDVDEDNDDDADGILDGGDNCLNGTVDWKSNLTNDIDQDGCRDETEDDDDDNDGIIDILDSCPKQLKPTIGEWELQSYGCWLEVFNNDNQTGSGGSNQSDIDNQTNSGNDTGTTGDNTTGGLTEGNDGNNTEENPSNSSTSDDDSANSAHGSDSGEGSSIQGNETDDDSNGKNGVGSGGEFEEPALGSLDSMMFSFTVGVIFILLLAIFHFQMQRRVE